MIFRFWTTIILVMACCLALGTGLILQSHRDLQASRRSLDSLAAFRIALDVANRVSAERGPSNRVMSEDPDPDGPSFRLLRDARAATDAVIERAAGTPALALSIPPLRRALATARREVDRLGDLAVAAYGMEDVGAAAEGMFSAYDATRLLIDRGIEVLLDTETDVVARALVMRMLSELRDFAGRLGSYLVIPMVHGQPIAPQDLLAFHRTEGRVRELWQLASQLTGPSSDRATREAHAAVAARFMGEGMDLLTRSIDEAQSGAYTMTATDLTASIVPTFRPLEELRDAYIDATIALLETRAAAARRSLFFVAAVSGLALMLVLLLLVASQTRVFRPLLRARHRVVELADGKLDETAEHTPPHGEMRDLYDALASLRTKLIERMAMTEQLRQQAETDGLTGALNRHALERLAEKMTQAGDASQRISTIMLDIDHFKKINDTFGHMSGDEVLKETVRRLRAVLRSDDILARFGGEEFCVILACDENHAPESAERLRRAVQDFPYQLETGQTVQVTASFGTAQAERRPGIWPRLVAAADAALYRAKLEGRNRVASQDLA
nr:GGDEF domain-containing protein [uncultured Roseococcus sp.]